LLISCSKEDLTWQMGDYQIQVQPGKHYLHDFELGLGLKKKNAPQMVIWAEDTLGNYLTTIYCTYRSATATWRRSPGEKIPEGGIRRESALPYWAHKWRAHVSGTPSDLDAYSGATSGAPVMPDANCKLVDGITGATATDGLQLKINPLLQLSQFCLYLEVNQSTDFNDAYPEDAEQGASNYSGGKLGSGQPALVYKIIVDRNSIQSVDFFRLEGHSSPDGTKGELYTNMEGIETALQIIKQIELTKY